MSRLVASQRAWLAPAWVREDLSRKAQALPSLDLRFAESKSLTDAASGQSLVTFTRASSGTYVGSNGVLQTATNDVPRFDHNPTTGESLGLLVEEQRTNLVTFSEQFDNAAWTKLNCNITSNVATAPNGTLTADLCAETTSAGSERNISTVVNAGSTGQVTRSIYIKPAGRYKVSMIGNAGVFYACYDLNALTVFDVNNCSVSILDAGNGWRRLILTASASTTFRVDVGLLPDSATGIANRFYTGDGTSGVYIWGAQLEAGAFPTSYIPTTTATATRSADAASITGTNFSSWYRQDEGTVFVNATAAVATSIIPCYVSVDNGTVSERMQLRRLASGTQSNYRVVAGGQSIDNSKTVGLPAGFNSQALAYASNNYEGSCNGILEGIISIANRPAATQMQIGSGISSVTVNGTIRRLTYWPVRLGNDVLQQITQ